MHGLLTKGRDGTLMAIWSQEWHAGKIPNSNSAGVQAVEDDLANLPIVAVKIVR